MAVKKILIILGAVFGVFVLLFAGIFYLVFNLTSAMPDAANRFFNAVRAKDVAAAEAELSEEFKTRTDRAELRRFIDSSGLGDVVDTEWDSRNIKNNRGELEGNAITSAGGRIPLKITFVQENEAWKIYAISKPGAGVAEGETGSLDLPDLATRTALAKRSMHDFAVALEEGTMASFYPTLSALWRNQTNVEELDTAFAVFFEQDIKLLSLDAMQPKFDGDPTIDDNGVLTLTGHYETSPSVVHFSQRYILEGTDWRLLGINVQLK